MRARTERVDQYDDRNGSRSGTVYLWFLTDWICRIGDYCNYIFIPAHFDLALSDLRRDVSGTSVCRRTYNYAKRGLNRVWANLAGWHYIISVVGIGAGETLAFSNYFKILFGELGINIEGVDSRIIAIVLVLFFPILNFRGIEMSGKAQTGFIFFFWGCAVAWFLYMIPHIHLDYFGGIAMDSLPPFKEMMYIFGLVWWCYTGFETCVSMGAETKYPQYTLPRALKVSVFLVFAVNALFQWFLVGLVPHEFYHILAVADAPYAEDSGLPDWWASRSFCSASALHSAAISPPSIRELRHRRATSTRWRRTVPCRSSCARYIRSIRHRIWRFLWSASSILSPIATGSINYIASVSLISLAVCYMIGCLAYLGLKKHYPDMNRPYRAPAGTVGCYVTIAAYTIILIFADRIALLTAAVVTVAAIVYWALFTRKHENKIPSIEEEIGILEEPSME